MIFIMASKLTASVFSIQRITPNLQQIYYGLTKAKHMFIQLTQ